MPGLSFYSSLGVVFNRAANEACQSQIRRLDINPPNLRIQINRLSGGNQQKALFARWMMMEPDILIVDEPTRGIDVGAKYEIHKLMTDLAETGKAVIMISSELPEIIGVSTRIITMCKGRITGELVPSEATQEVLMRLLTVDYNF
jgi:inositol transport system ATP-binding protein